MGKHDKKEEQTTVFSWQPMPDDWYKARIQTLEKENLELRKQIEKNNVDWSIVKEVKEANRKTNDDYIQGLIEEHREEIKFKESEIQELEYQIEKLKEAVVLAALREV